MSDRMDYTMCRTMRKESEWKSITNILHLQRWHLAKKLVRDGLIWSENLTIDPDVSWKENFQK